MSRDSIKIYKDAEEKNAQMIRKVRKFVIIGLMVCYFPSILPPISFLIIGIPEPQQWQLPFVVWMLIAQYFGESFGILYLYIFVGRCRKWAYIFRILHFMAGAIQ